MSAVPFWCWSGGEDQLTPPALAEEIAAAAPAARLEVIRNSGHLSTLEQPQAVNTTLLATCAH